MRIALHVVFISEVVDITSSDADNDPQVRIIKTSMLKEYWEDHREAETSLRTWVLQTQAAEWRNFVEVRKTFPSADLVKVNSGRPVGVFDVAHNRYRLIAAVHYNMQIVYTLNDPDAQGIRPQRIETSVMKTKTLTRHNIPESYAELVSLFMPRPLHDDVDYRNALDVLDAMAGFKLLADQQDYFEAIATFVEKYEALHHALDCAKMTPVELIRSLMDEHAMSESDLGRLLGDRSLGHRILTGERKLSKAHIRVLAGHFSLNLAVLF